MLTLEELESRLAPATFTWAGAGADANWSTAANWQGGVAPTATSALAATFIFGSGESQLTNINNITGLDLGQIQVAGGYAISGDSLTLTGAAGGGIDSQSGTNTFANAIALGANLSFTEEAGQLSLTGIISGAHSITQGGIGILLLGGTNTFTGTTTISAGTLKISAARNLGATPASATPGAVTINGGTLATTATFTLTTNLGISLVAANSTIDVANGTTLAYSGIVAGTGGLTKVDTGTLTLGGANTWTGDTTIGAGILSIKADANLGTAPASATPGTLTVNGGTLATTTTFTLNANRGIDLGVSGGTFSPSSGTTLTYNGVADDTGGLSKINTGTIILGGANTYSGTTAVTAGTLKVGATNALPTSGPLTVNGGTFDLNGFAQTVGTLADGGVTTGTVTDSGATATFTVNTATANSFSGTFKGSLALAMTGGGTLTLKKANTYTGATTVSAGTLIDGIANALPVATTLTVTGSGTFNLGGFAQTLAGLADGGVGTGIITDSGTAVTFTVTVAITSSYSGLITGALALTKTGAGTLTLANANTWSGATTVSVGTLANGFTNALPPTTILTVSGTGTFDLGGYSQLLSGLSGGGVATGTVTDSGAAAALMVSNTVSDTYGGLISGALTLDIAGTNKLILSKANTYTGGTVITGGTLSIAADANLGTAPGSVTAGNVTLNGGILAVTTTFTLSANRGISFGASGGTIDVASGITLTYTGIAAGVGGLTKVDTGTLVLGGANTYAGATVISAGILKDSLANALPTGTILTVSGTGKFDLGGVVQQVAGLSDGGVTTGTLTDSGVAAIFTINTATTNSYSGLISGTLVLTKTGAGTLTLNHTNTNTGATAVSGGTLMISADANLGTAPGSTTPGFLTLNGGTLATTATLTLSSKRGISFGTAGGSFDEASGTTLTYAGIAAGTGGCTKLDSGTLVLGGVNTFTGITTITAGTLDISGDSNLGAAPGSATPGDLVFNGGTLATTTTFTLNANRGISFSASGGTIDVAASTTVTYAGIAAGAGGWNKTDGGTLVLGGVGTWTGTTTVSGGALKDAVANALSTSSTLTVSGTGTFNISGFAQTLAGLADGGVSTGTVTDSGAAAVLMVNSSTTNSFSGSITGSLSLSLTGMGTLILSGSNTWTGTTTISAGTLQIGNSGTTGTFGTGTVTDNATLTFDRIDAGLTLNVAIRGTGSVDQIGSGIVTLSAANSWSGTTTISAGILKDGVANALPVGTTLTVDGSGILDLNGFAQTVAGLTDGGVSTGTITDSGAAAIVTANNATTCTFSGTISGAVALNKTAGGELVVGATNTYSGATTVSAGTLQDGIANALPIGTALILSGTGTFDLDGFAQQVGSLADGGVSTGNLTDSGATSTFTVDNFTANSFAGLISGNLAFTKAGTGTLTFTNANTYSGPTTINAGNLVVDGSQPDSAVTVNGGSFLGGTSGTVGTLNVVGGTLSPGAALGSSGILGASNVNLGSAAVYNVNLNGTTAGTSYDQLNISGTVTIDSSATLNITLDYVPTYDDSYTIINNDGSDTVMGTFASLPEGAVIAAGGSQFQITYHGGTGNDVVLTCIATGYATGTSTAIASSSANSVYGQSVTFTATVTPGPGGVGTPTGPVTFHDGSTTLGTGTLSTMSGLTSATFTTSTLIAGTHSQIYATYSGDTNYTSSTSSILTPTVAQAPLTVTANNLSKTYGGADPTLTYAVTGTFYNGDTTAVISGVILATVTGAVATAGTHAITVSGATATNYAITEINGTLTVAQAALTVTADNQNKVYGATDPTLTYTCSGTLYYSDSHQVISGVSLSTVTGAAATAGTQTITASGGTAANYAITDINGTLVVSQAALTVTANDQAKVYGAADPTLIWTASGTFYYGDTSAVITGVVVSTTTGAAATAGTHTIIASGGTAANYTITDVNGTLTVSQASLTVTADNQSKVYGGSDPTLTWTATGSFYYGDTSALITGVGLSAPTGANATAGTQTITTTGGVAVNYALTDVNGTLTVAQAALTVTADNQSKTYGDVDPTLTYTPSGTLYYGDSYAVISGVSLSTVTGAAASAGAWAITASGATATNYALTYISGTLTVYQAALTVTADDQEKVYGAADPGLTYTVSGTLFYSDTTAVISGVSLSTTIGGAATAGTHTITATGGSAANYAITDANGTLTVSQASLTVTANNQSKIYGGADPVLSWTPGTLYYGDTSAVITGVVLSAPTGGAATAGTHTITATGGTATNYLIIEVDGTLTVSQATLTVTADNQSKTYGANDPTLTFTPSGMLYYGDAYSVINGVSLSTTTGAAATAGTHIITTTGGVATNYAITGINGTLTVAKASLTVTADDQSKIYGANDPNLTYTTSGVLYYGDAYSVITGVVLATTTGAAATAGTHSVTVAGGAASNYAINNVDGTLAVSKASLTVTADNQSKVYGATDPTLTYSTSTLYYGDGSSVISGVSLSTVTGAAATAGAHLITATGGTAANYDISDVNGTLTVAKAALTVVASNQSKVYGAGDPDLIWTVGGDFYYGDGASVISGVSLSTVTGATATAGTHDITTTGGVAANYTISDVNGTLTVDKALLTVTADNQSKIYGGADPALTWTPGGTLYYGDAWSVISGIALATTKGAAATAGTHAITVTGGAASNYVIVEVDGTLTVDKAALTITADNQSKVYGGSDPSLSYTIGGTLYYRDTDSVITGVVLLTATGLEATIGTHAITLIGGTAANYVITDVNGTLSVDRPALTVTPTPVRQSNDHGAANVTTRGSTLIPIEQAASILATSIVSDPRTITSAVVRFDVATDGVRAGGVESEKTTYINGNSFGLLHLSGGEDQDKPTLKERADSGTSSAETGPNNQQPPEEGEEILDDTAPITFLDQGYMSMSDSGSSQWLLECNFMVVAETSGTKANGQTAGNEVSDTLFGNATVIDQVSLCWEC